MSRGKHITPETRELVIATYKSGLTYKEVADKLGISFSTVGNIVRASGYDRYHVGSQIAKSVPVANIPQKPVEAPQSRSGLRVASRTLKLQSELTGFLYTISTDSDVVEIESDSALMQIQVGLIDSFIEELNNIKRKIGNPS